MSIPSVTRVSEGLVISTPQRDGIRLIVSGPQKCETTETNKAYAHNSRTGSRLAAAMQNKLLLIIH